MDARVESLTTAFECALRSAGASADLEKHRSAYEPSQQDVTALETQVQILKTLESQATELIGEMTPATVGSAPDKLIAVIQDLRFRASKQASIDLALLAPWRRLPTELMPYRHTGIGVGPVAEARHLPQRHAQLCRAIFEELRRSSQAPLHVTVSRADYAHELDAVPYYDHDGVWQVVLKHSHRWASFEMMKHFPRTYFRASQRRLSFPLLRQIRLVAEYAAIPKGSDLLGDSILPLSLFKNAPTICDVSLTYMSSLGPLRLPRAWTITHLTIGCGTNAHWEFDPLPGLAPIPPVLAACSSTLRTCVINASHMLGYSPDVQPVVAFPVLRHIYFDGVAGLLLRHITAPSLQLLSLVGRNSARDAQQYGDALDALAVMCARGGCPNLYSLVLNEVHARPTEVIACLRSFPSVRNVELSNDHSDREGPLITDDVIRALTRGRATTDALLPRLISLHLHYRLQTGSALPQHELHNICAMLASRRQHRPGLNFLSVLRIDDVGDVGQHHHAVDLDWDYTDDSEGESDTDSSGDTGSSSGLDSDA
ncbi:hypothetical protein K525DRAFT_285653 [Schizophyllum commune Loenen D]|nr:hypothetical protein K525DRAFT_285653 [Schizophyllum commune Loenen D]